MKETQAKTETVEERSLSTWLVGIMDQVWTGFTPHSKGLRTGQVTRLNLWAINGVSRNIPSVLGRAPPLEGSPRTTCLIPSQRDHVRGSSSGVGQLPVLPGWELGQARHWPCAEAKTEGQEGTLTQLGPGRSPHEHQCPAGTSGRWMGPEPGRDPTPQTLSATEESLLFEGILESTQGL